MTNPRSPENSRNPIPAAQVEQERGQNPASPMSCGKLVNSRTKKCDLKTKHFAENDQSIREEKKLDDIREIQCGGTDGDQQ